MTTQLTTFYVGKDLYGIEVMRVQEVTAHLPVIHVPLAPNFVKGLINLRGQIATALGLKELFCISDVQASESLESEVSVVCKFEGNLVSLLVDSIGDVIEVSDSQFEPCPEIVPSTVRKFLKGIYKIDGALLSVIDLERLSHELLNTTETLELKAV